MIDSYGFWGKRGVLQAVLRAFSEIPQPGGVIDLPYKWDSDLRVATHPEVLPPIAGELRRYPWLIPKFYNRTPPERGLV